jgi:hypothetical protein
MSPSVRSCRVRLLVEQTRHRHQRQTLPPLRSVRWTSRPADPFRVSDRDRRQGLVERATPSARRVSVRARLRVRARRSRSHSFSLKKQLIVGMIDKRMDWKKVFAERLIQLNEQVRRRRRAPLTSNVACLGDELADQISVRVGRATCLRLQTLAHPSSCGLVVAAVQLAGQWPTHDARRTTLSCLDGAGDRRRVRLDVHRTTTSE